MRTNSIEPRDPDRKSRLQSGVRAFKTTQPGAHPEADIDVLERTGDSEKQEREPEIICRFCAGTVTSRKHQVEINGAHVHLFRNPANIYYRIGCFKYAPGCAQAGDTTMEHTWFPGFQWRVVLCRSCFHHLGWYFSSDANNFYGLVLDYLDERE